MGKTSGTLVMGVLNLTPDSFSDGGQLLEPGAALKRAKRMVDEGADILDLGGESTKPGNPAVSLDEELKRVLPAAELIAKELPEVKWSIDTQKAEVARRCLELGAFMLNDVSALRADEKMAEVVAGSGRELCLMHRLGEPRNSSWSTAEAADYGAPGVVETVLEFLLGRVEWAVQKGISRKKIWIDPGLGFGKSVADNFLLMGGLERFVESGSPVLLGASRKSMLGAVTGDTDTSDRLEATLAVTALAAMKGCACVRVHDVKENKKVIQTINAIKGAG